MKSPAYTFLVFFLTALVFPATGQIDVLHYKSNVVDTIFGKAVPDPYRWMENTRSDLVREWLQEQKKITKAEQKKFKGRMGNAEANMNVNSDYMHSTAEKTGPWYFQMMVSHNVFYPSPVLYYRENDNDPFDIAFNPNDIGKAGSYTIHNWALSDSGGFLAVAISEGGSDWLEIRVRNLYKQKDLDDKLDHVKFGSIVWWHNGFFYSGYRNSTQTTAALAGQQLYYHKLGTSQNDDVLLLSIPAQRGYALIEFQKTSNQRYLIVNRNQKIGNDWYNITEYKDLNEGLEDAWKHIVRVPATEKAYFKVIDYADSGFLISTNFKAPHGRVLKASLTEANKFTEVVVEQDIVLKEVNYVHHQLVAIYFTAGQYEVCMFNINGQIMHTIKFEAGIEVEGFEGKPDDDETIFYERTFYLPTVVNRYDFIAEKSERVNKTYITFNAGEYTTQVVNYKSKDGTEVSMYLTYKKGLKLKNNNPVILYGYGGFGISIIPEYSYSNIVFFDNNGILAVPMIRGGGEHGEAWHDAGRGLNKQNSFDDFTAAAQYLINEGYTSKERLAIMGGSNGGLLVGAVMTQHPDLCKVVIGQVGAYDMIRYPKFTAGKYWLSEYGNPDNVTDFNNLLSYSPLHNVKPGITYPATLFITGKNDDRVVPFHTYKFLARLQECSTGDNPHILYFEEDAGHNGATNLSGYYSQEAFILAFIFTEMHLPLK